MDYIGKEIYGLVISIEITLLYIIDNKGNICLLNGKKEIINRYYHIYYFNDKTKYMEFEKSINPNIAIIKLKFLDEIKQIKNQTLIINDNTINIIDKIQFFSLIMEDESYDLQSFELIINDNTKIFKTFIYKGEINTIYCSLKENNKSNKNYEVLYLSKESKYLPKSINISGYKIEEFDQFNCTNRIRFNIINVEKDESLYNYNDNVTSYEIIYLINEKNKTSKYGVFDLESYRKAKLKDFIINTKYSKVMEAFYNDYKYNKQQEKTIQENVNYYITESSKLNINNVDQDELFKKSNANISEYKKESLNKDDVFNYFKNYFFFIFVHHMLNQGKCNNWDKYFDFLDIIKNYDNYTKIRLLSGFIDIIKNYEIVPILIDIVNLDKNNPYNLAVNLQKSIISNLNEKSNIFYALLQFNSKILRILPDNYFTFLKEKIQKYFNKNISQNYAYTISLENIGEIKSHLMSIEENFFFIIAQMNNYNFYGVYNKYSKTTVINQYTLYKDIYIIKEEAKKDYAFSLNMVISHERMCQGKEGSCLCIQGINSPCIFFNNDFKRDYIFSSYSSNEGEAGRVLEKFVGPQLLVKVLKENKIYGKFLDYKYFIGDFKELKNEVLKTIENDHFYMKVKNIKFFILIIEFAISILI